MSPTTYSPPAPPLQSRAQTEGVGRFRWTICGLLFFSVAINYIDRNIIGILKMPLSRELGWSETDYAHIASAFQMAYACGYLFGGWTMDRLGVKRGLPWFVGLWSLAAAAHGLCSLIPHTARFELDLARFGAAAVWSVPMTAFGFMAARIALGLAEGGNFPGAIKTVAEWFPVKERALATGIFNAGSNVGAILCPVAVPWMYQSWGWALTFYLTGALGVLWLVAWLLIYEAPERHRRLSAAERDYIMASPRPAAAAAPAARVPWLSLFKYRAVWAYMAASILAGPVWGVYMFFLPDFLQKQFGLTLVEVGTWTAVFYFLASFGGVGGGWLAAKLMGRGWSVNAARKTTLLLCAAAVVPIFLATHVHTVWLTVCIVGLAGSAHQGWSANLYSVVSDTMPRQAVSSTVGLGGFVAFMTGAFAAEMIGRILQATGSYASIFATASLLYLASLGIVHVLVPRIGARENAA